MPRFLSTLLVIALLGGTAAAFAVTQGLKNQPSPIRAPAIAKVFSPTCDCATRVATIRFRLRKPDRVRLQIVDDAGDVVRTLVPGRRLRRGTVSYTWNGRDDQGRFVAQGIYKPRVHLTDQHRTIDLPNDMRVDTTPPEATLAAIGPESFSPDGDGHADRVVIRYRLSERGHAILAVNGRGRFLFTRTSKPTGEVEWNGDFRGRRLPPGTYALTLQAQDIAGNVSDPVKLPDLTLRYVQLARNRVEARARTRFGVRVFADARVHFRLGRRSGSAAPGLMILRAPAKPGRYALVVSVGEHSARATVIVGRR